MAFQRVKEGKTSLWPEVCDTDFRIRIEYTTRDMPKNPGQSHVMVRRDGRFLFSFDLTHTVEKEPALTFVYSGRRADIVRGYEEHKALFPEFHAEDQFVSYIRGGVELMFNSEAGIARGQSFVCRFA